MTHKSHNGFSDQKYFILQFTIYKIIIISHDIISLRNNNVIFESTF